MARRRAVAEPALEAFAEKYRAKYARAVDCLVKDRDDLLAFCDVPAERWGHLQTTDPVESMFAAVRHRTMRTEGALSPQTARLMVLS